MALGSPRHTHCRCCEVTETPHSIGLRDWPVVDPLHDNAQHSQQTLTPPACLVLPAIPASKQPQSQALEGAVTLIVLTVDCKGKGKAIPLQALTGPEGSRRLRLPDFRTIGT
jgi:hypothetical protein